MTHTRRPTTYADVMKMSGEYRGQNGAGQHLYANGSPLITDTFDTIEELVERFGPRVNLHEKEMKHSGPYAAGMKAGFGGDKYDPRVDGVPLTRPSDRQEYGLGFIRGLVQK